MDSLNPPGAADGTHYDCLVISDLHLGSDICQAKLLEEFLIWAVEHCDQLVINGDIFDDLNFKRLTKRHFACLKVIRRNTDRADFRLVWVRGNHDGPVDIISHVVGVDILDEYVFDNHRIRLLILHGDQFDTIVTVNPLLTDFACAVFYFIQKWMPHKTSRFIRRISKKFQRNSQRIERRAVEYARAHGFRFVTCGHTHLPLVARARRGFVPEQRHLDRVSAVSVRGGRGGRSPTGVLATGQGGLELRNRARSRGERGPGRIGRPGRPCRRCRTHRDPGRMRRARDCGPELSQIW